MHISFMCVLANKMINVFVKNQWIEGWGDVGLIPGLGRSHEEWNGYPLHYSCLGNLMGRGAWWAIIHGVAKSWTWLSDLTHTHRGKGWREEREAQEGGDICIIMADLHCLWQKSTQHCKALFPIKNKFKSQWNTEFGPGWCQLFSLYQLTMSTGKVYIVQLQLLMSTWGVRTILRWMWISHSWKTLIFRIYL